MAKITVGFSLVQNNKNYIVIITLILSVGLSVCHHQGSSILDKRSSSKTEAEPKLKYILLWNGVKTSYFTDMGVGQKTFIDRKCPHVNCYVTSNRNLMENVTMFDVIAFSGSQMTNMSGFKLPEERSPHQKYAFVTTESSASCDLCDSKLDGFFNWTWTYKLDSDAKWGYIIVRDINGTIIGPKKEMHWIKHEDMLPVSEKIKSALKNKSKLAAWFVSKCITKSNREKYIAHLNTALRSYNQKIDIYGNCGDLKCPRGNIEVLCHEMIHDDYYFYMAFEHSFSEDYVTEKVLLGLLNNAVPIVYGGANYSRFLPPGSYIDARNMTRNELAQKMIELFTNFDKYVEYFRWRNHYTIQSPSFSPNTDWYCSVCALVNDDSKFKQKTVYKDFRKWWDFHYRQSNVCWAYIINTAPVKSILKSILS